MVKCERPECQAELINDGAVALHAFDHRLADNTSRLGSVERAVKVAVAAGVQQFSDKLPALTDQIGARIQALEQAVDALPPQHAQLIEVVSHAQDCPGCKSVLADIKATLTEEIKGAAPAAKPAEAIAPPPAASLPADKPPDPQKAQPKVKLFDWDTKLRPLTLNAYGLKIEEAPDGIRVGVKPGWEDEADAGLKELIEDGHLPEGCVIAVGPDGKTKMVCEG